MIQFEPDIYNEEQPAEEEQPASEKTILIPRSTDEPWQLWELWCCQAAQWCAGTSCEILRFWYLPSGLSRVFQGAPGLPWAALVTDWLWQYTLLWLVYIDQEYYAHYFLPVIRFINAIKMTIWCGFATCYEPINCMWKVLSGMALGRVIVTNSPW